MCPLAPVWALGGRGVAALGLHAGQKDPWACRERSLTHIVSPSGLASSYFSDSGYRGADEHVCKWTDALGYAQSGGIEEGTCCSRH